MGAIIFGMTCSLFFPFPQRIFATTDLEKKQSQLQDIIDKINAYKKISDLKERQRLNLSVQLESLEAQARKLEADITENESKLTTLESEMKTLEDRIKEKQEAIDIQKDILLDLFRYYYVDQSEEDEPLFFSPVEIGKFMFSKEVSAQTGDRINTTLTNLEALKQSVADEYEVISGKKIEADTLKLQLLERNSYLESTKDNKVALLEQTKREEKKYDNLIDNLQQERDDIENEINELEAGKVGDLDLKDLPDFGKSILIYPVKDYRFTQGYGKTSFSKKAYASGKHNGIDLANKVGTPIYAAADGKVVGVGNNGRYAYGRWIAIEHGNGLTTLYGHLSSQSVSKGKKVSKGQKIGAMGNTGYSTGPHLHFTVFSSKSFEIVASKKVSSLKDIPVGATVNPLNYLPKK
jgi:murein DD-endopeptidase MepM/ murein hydrolase activator NlpD